MYKYTKTEKDIIESRKLPLHGVKVCSCFEYFLEMMDEAQYSVKKIFANRIKIDKRKSLEDWEDIFENNVAVKYFFNNRNLYIGVGNYYD